MSFLVTFDQFIFHPCWIKLL